MQDVIGWFADFFTWVKEKMAFEETRQALLSDLGIETTGPTPEPNIPQTNIDSIRSYQQSVNPDRQALMSVLADIRAIVTSLFSFFASFQLSPSEVVEVTHRALNLLALNYIRIREPHYYFIAQLLDFIEDTGTPFLSGKVSWNRFVDLFTDGVGYLLETILIDIGDEEEAQQRSDFYFTPLAYVFSTIFGEKGKALYGWDAAPESTTPKADAISRRMLSAAFLSRDVDPATNKVIEKQINTSLYFLTPAQNGPGLFLTLGGSGDLEALLGEKWKVIFKMSSGALVDMTIGGANIFTIRGPAGGPTDIRTSLALQSVPDETNRSFVLPGDSDTHVEIGNIAFTVALNSAEAEIKLSLNECALVIATKDNDGFMASLLPSEGLRLPFNFGIGASNKRGLFTEGNIPLLSGRSTGGSLLSDASNPRLLARTRGNGAPTTALPASPSDAPVPIAGAIGKGFSVPIPIGKSLGPVNLHSLLLKLAATTTTTDPSDVTVEASAALSLKLGPAFISIDRLGFQLNVAFPESGGNLVFADLSMGPALPRGVGVTIDSAVVTGGGFLFLDQERGQYAGVVMLELGGGVAVKAIGLIATRLPNGSKGFSLLVIITAEGFKPIPLGLGFKLTAIGGLLAINRTFNEGVLREGIKNHTLDSVLFPANPTRDALQLLSTLDKVFPIAKGHHLFGPMVEIVWGTPTIFTMQLGIVLEIGARLRLLVVGQIEAILPKKENDLLRLKMDVVGILDFDQGTAALDAVLYDSRLLKKFVLTGGMALRLKWKGAPNFALAIGGMHHAFNPPANFPRLDRIAISLSSGDNPRITCEAYFAITSNTVQFGARANLYAGAHGFSIEGDIGFDVLIQFNPFHFLAEFHASIQLKRGSRNLFKVSVSGALEGPRPLRVRGKASFEIFWWDISISFDKTLVEGERPAPPPAINVLNELSLALGDARNWAGTLPDGERRLVSVREMPTASEVAIHPLGKLAVKQTVVPLNLTRDIDKFGNTTPSGPRRFTVSSITVGGQAQTPKPLLDFFAPAQFFEMSDDQAIVSPSFETMEAGLMIGADDFVFSDADKLAAPLTFKTIIVDKQSNTATPTKGYELNAARLFAQAAFGAAARSEVRRTGNAKYQNRERPPAVTLNKPGWVIASTDDLSLQTIPGVEAGRQMNWIDAQQALQRFNQQNPNEAKKRQIVPSFEIG
ncbi:MAG: hypothetical protein H0W76_13875 [Pyrinomonadaceae bacterium]|nr:hypothetical protein [Pyrinomonadaceae bacterium]